MSDYTIRFDVPKDDSLDTREILSQVYTSLQQKGYRAYKQCYKNDIRSVDFLRA